MFPMYREATILYKEGSNPMETLYKIMDSIIFQSTYQWFSNAVTPSWWNNIWMNGGVAEYLKHYIMDKVKFQFTNISIVLVNTLRSIFAQTLNRSFCLDTWKLAV